MQTRYFNKNGVELIPGLSTEVAAYSTNDPNDIILTPLPDNKVFNIVDGVVTIVDRSYSKVELSRKIIEMRDEKIRVGMSATGTYRVNGVEKEGYTYRIRISDRIKSDIMSLALLYMTGTLTNPTPLKVGEGVYVILKNMTNVMEIFANGSLLVNTAYAIENECNDMLTAAESTDGLTDIFRAKFATLDVRVNMS